MRDFKLLKRLLLRVLILLMVTTLVLFTPGGVLPAPQSQPGPSLNVSPDNGIAGSVVTLSGGNWQANIDATIRWDGADKSSFHIGAGGSFSNPFTIPSNAQSGNHTITVCLGIPCTSGEFYVGRDVTFTVLQPTQAPPPPPTATRTPTITLTASNMQQVVTLPPNDLPPMVEVPVCTLAATGTVINFDELNPNDLVNTLYVERGVFISAPGRGMRAVIPGSGTYTPSLAIKHDFGGVEFGSAGEPVTFVFISPQALVGMRVGLDEVTSGPVTATLTAYDESGASISSYTTVLAPGPIPVDVCMLVQQPAASGPIPIITSVVLSYDSVASEVLDHLFFSQGTMTASPDTGGVEVDIRIPENDSDLLSLIQEIWGVVRSSEPIERVELFQNVSDGETVTPLLIGRPSFAMDEATGATAFYLRRAPLDPDVQSITAIAYDISGNEGQDTVNVHPIEKVITNAKQNFDIRVKAVEVTQGIRGDIPTFQEGGQRLDETVEHVADRQTVVRVYPQLAVTNGVFQSGLSARLIGTRYGAILPGSPLIPENPELVIDPSRTLETMRGDAGMSWNFVLPDEWVREGTIDLTIEVNPPGPFFHQECVGCDDNNSNYLTSVRFTPTGTLSFYPYLIQNHPQNWGSVIPGVSPSPDEVASALRWMQQAWPIPNNGIVINPAVSVSADCIPGAPFNSMGTNADGIPVIDNFTGLNCDTLLTATIAARARASLLGVNRGDPILFPLIESDTSSRGCSGRAGLSNPVYWSGACGPTLAQETWHAAGGYNHAGNQHNEQRGGGTDPNYPDPHGGIERNAWGFDVLNMEAIPPTTASNHTHDFMSYGWLGNPGNAWISLYTWNNIIAWFNAANTRTGQVPGRAGLAVPPAFPSPDDGFSNAMIFSGEINSVDGITIDPIFLDSIPGEWVNNSGEGSYRLELRSATGNILFTRFFDPFVITHAADEPSQFFEALPLITGTAEIVLFRNDVEIARVRKTANSPVITLNSPIEGETWKSTGTINVSWSAVDSDNDRLTYLVETSPDGGQSWQILVETDLTSANIDLANIPGSGEDWHLRVQASDGFNSSIAEISGISVVPKPPQPYIMFPADGSTFTPGASLTLSGQAGDFRDGILPNSALEWIVDGVVVGHGTRWPALGLDPGQHTVILKATNSVGLSAETQVSIIMQNPESTSQFFLQRWLVFIIIGAIILVILIFGAVILALRKKKRRTSVY